MTDDEKKEQQEQTAKAIQALMAMPRSERRRFAKAHGVSMIYGSTQPKRYEKQRKQMEQND